MPLPERIEPTPQELLQGFEEGRVGSLARAITWAEEERSEIGPILETLTPQLGQSWRTGVTGPPGAGKSTLVDALVLHWANKGNASKASSLHTALVAIDPSSPFTGGALLGDRVRMDQSLKDAGVFVRSMANRGSLGGLSLATGAAADLCDAFGFDEVILETVGVGQAEVDIASASDLVLVVLTPQSGDGIQAMKAGLMEVADIIVVNKSDSPNAERFKNEVESVLSLRESTEPEPTVVACSATQGMGLSELSDAIDARRQLLEEGGQLKKRRAARSFVRVRRLVEGGLRNQLWSLAKLEERAELALAEGKHPDAVAAQLLAELMQHIHTQTDESTNA